MEAGLASVHRAASLALAGMCLLLWCPTQTVAQVRRPPPPPPTRRPPPPPVRPRRPPQDLLRLSVGAGEQTTTLLFEDNQTFPQYLETGSFKFTRTIPMRPFFDAAVAVRVYRRIYGGMAVSVLNDVGTGIVTAQVPHPLLFTQMRTAKGDVGNVVRREIGEHFQVLWVAPPWRRRLEMSVFGGPSIFITEQTYVTQLALGLDHETYPFDTFEFAGATTNRFTGRIIGYNAGADLTWRFSRHVGAGVLIRYSDGKQNFTPTGGAPFKVRAGGLQAAGGLRIILQH
jgi:hypothetical protein